MSDEKSIFVTQPHLPPLQEFIPYLERIWANKILTNNGPVHKQLEDALCNYLGVKYVSLFNNATNALITALQTLRITGEVITTPYSFIATANSLIWNRVTPVFVDIHPESLNLDPDKIEAAITDKTTAIMAVHCYGRPCDVDAIKKIADSHKLKVIYDAAHAFGVTCHCGSVLNHGDLSVLSFHATKVFNTFEGGAIVCSDATTKKRIDSLKNFGFENEVTVCDAGMNGKMSEINAAFGLLQLGYVDAAISKRREVDYRYRQGLQDALGITCIYNDLQFGHNYSYFPILVESEYPLSRNGLYERLKSFNIYTRRYFYPLISSFTQFNILPSSSLDNLPVANSISEKVLCLPIYPELKICDQERIISKITEEIS